MAKQQQSEFRFRKTDTIGAASAEEDSDYLSSCFVETEEYEAIQDRDDIRQIVLGRTGSGKSALFERLKHEENERVISIEPDELALTYVANSTIIGYFSDLGVNLDPFYKLLWRHVLTVEVLRKHFEPRVTSEGGAFWSAIIERFKDPTRHDKRAKQSVEYLQQWGEKFWLETEYRVQEITRKLESDLSAKLNIDVRALSLKAGASSQGKTSVSETENTEVVNRAQRIVSDAQIHDLNRVRDVLEAILTDRQQYYYVLIDRLDESWVEDNIRYRLIMALIDSARELSKASNVKVLISIRRDLIERVFRQVRDTGAGFQEEKYQSLYVPLHWSKGKIIEILDKRINALVTRRYQKKQRVTHKDLLPAKIDKQPVDEFIAERTPRPRDVIIFFNKCIEESEGKPRLSVDTLRRAEGEYSRQRLRALSDEWHADYPGLLEFVDVLKKRPPIFPIEAVSRDDISDRCLQSAVTNPDGPGELRGLARLVSEDKYDIDAFIRELFMTFFRVGLVGFKLETFESPSWVDELGQGVSTSEIDLGTRVVVHATYRRSLGIRSR